MSNAAVDPRSMAAPATRGQVWAWGLWDWGSAAFNAVILTFVFSVYLTDAVGDDLPGTTSASTWFAWSLGIAGLVVAVLAPVTGQRADASGHRKRALGIWTYLCVLGTAGLFFVRNDYHYLWLGLVLISVASVCAEFATVSYYAMLRQVSNPANIGRVSGFGWSMGYFGGIVLLLVCYVGFISGEDGSATKGLFEVSTDGGLNIRVIAIFAAVWFGLFAHPGAVQGARGAGRSPGAGGSGSSPPTACSGATWPTCTGSIATRCTSWAPRPCSGTGWRRSSRSGRSWRTPCTAYRPPTC